MIGRSCIKCGYLAVRNNSTGQLEEVENDLRLAGLIEVGAVERRPPLIPRCFVMRPDMANAIHDHGGYPDGIKPGLMSRNNCTEFVEWHQGFTPKEHKIMRLDIQAKTIEAKDRENERQSKRTEKWHDRLFAVILLFVGAALGYTLKGNSPPPIVNVNPILQVPDPATQK